MLGGYSQGAAVIDAITVAQTPTLGFTSRCRPASPTTPPRSRYSANSSIRLLGGPLTALSPLSGAKTIDLCNGADPVSSNGNDVAAHSLYEQTGLTTQAAQFVANRLTEAPVSRLSGRR